MKKDENKKMKLKKKLGLLIIILGILLIISGFIYASYKTDLFKNKKEINENDNDNEITESVAERFEGIYIASNDKIYIHKINDYELHYVIADSFQGTAKIIDKNTAREETKSLDDSYFEFKLVDDEIDVEYHSDDNNLPGLKNRQYKKISGYVKENIYEEEFVDSKYLDLIYSGLYVSDNGTELYVIHTSGNDLRVISKSNNDSTFGFSFNERFEIRSSDIRTVSYIDPDKNEIDYELKFVIKELDDKEFDLIVYDDVVGVDKDSKKFESKYKFKRAITRDEIIDKFYSNY